MAKNLRLPISDLAPGQRELPAEAARYVLRVHRLREGDRLVLFDPAQGVEADARLVSTSATGLCEVSELRSGRRPGMAGLCLVQCLGKGDKAEQVIRDATALGVGRIRLVESERSVSRLTDKASQKRARYESVALSAARQCLRSDVPVIEPLAKLHDCSSAPLAGVHWVLHPAAESGLTHALRDFSGLECTLWIGPEGGFAPQELAQLVSAGATLQNLGEWVLRTETAATVALALLSARVRDNKLR